MATSEQQGSSEEDEYEEVDINPDVAILLHEDLKGKATGKVTVRKQRSSPVADRSALSLAGLDDDPDEKDGTLGLRGPTLFTTKEERENYFRMEQMKLKVEKQIDVAMRSYSDLKLERKEFEQEFRLQQIEVRGEHDARMGELSDINGKIASLGSRHDGLLLEATELEQTNATQRQVLEKQRQESAVISQKIKEGQALLKRIEEEAVAITKQTQEKKSNLKGPTTPPAPTTPMGQSTPAAGVKFNASRRDALKKLAKEIEDDQGFLDRITSRVDTVVTQRVSGMLQDSFPRGHKTDSSEDDTSDDSIFGNSKPRKKTTAKKPKYPPPTPGRNKPDKPLPVRRRMTMLPDEVEIFESNPTIAKLGLDAMAGKEDQATAVEWSKDRMDQIHQGPRVEIPAKKQAVTPKPFDGSISWKKWFSRFCEDMSTNGWNDSQIMGSLMTCLRDGPGEDALWTFEENGDGTLATLVTTAAWICGPLHGDDPGVELETRRQKKGESFRKFGMSLRRLAKEAFEGLSPSEPWLVRKLAQLFIDGLEDSSLAKELAYHWKTDMSLNDLFRLADDCNRKKVLLRTSAVSGIHVQESTMGTEWEPSSPPTAEVAAYNAVADGVTVGQDRHRGRGRGRGRARRVESGGAASEEPSVAPDLLAAIRKIVEETIGRGRGRGRGTSDANTCFKCRGTGHWARNCPTNNTAAVTEEVVGQFEEAPENSPTGN